MNYYFVCPKTRKVSMKFPPIKDRNDLNEIAGRFEMLGKFNMWRDATLPHNVAFGFGDVDYELDEEIENWIIENTTGMWGKDDSPFLKYYFEKSADAIAFKLRWY